jgi:DNA polymerase I-like protein with 3'-5' exonuclease and polymerase domains
MIREVMENPPVKRMFGADLTVPIEVDIETGTHWGDVIP